MFDECLKFNELIEKDELYLHALKLSYSRKLLSLQIENKIETNGNKKTDTV